MNNRRINLFFLTFLFFFISKLSAQDADKKAIAAIDDIINNFDYYGKVIDLKVIFRENDALRPFENKAVLRIYKDNIYFKMNDVEQFTRDDTTYFVNHSNKEIYTYTNDDFQNFFSFRELLNNYKDKYIPKMDIIKKGKKPIQFIKLIPIEKNDLNYVLIGILKSTNRIETIINVFDQYQVDVIVTKVKKDVSDKKNYYFDRNKLSDYFISEVVN